MKGREMCIGTPAIIVEVNEEYIAKIDYGDGIIREAIIGISEKLSKGNTVIVHAGIIISKIEIKELIEQIKFLMEISETEFKEEINQYKNLIEKSKKLEGISNG